MMQSRTHNCGELRLSDVGKSVTIVGWLENVREVGANFAFCVLRDFYGTTQVVIETEEMMKLIKPINKESTISVTGLVQPAALRDQQEQGRRREHPAQIPLPRPAQPRREVQHRPALPGGCRAAAADDREGIFGDHHPHPHRFLP